MVTIIIGLSLPTIGSFLYLMGKTPYGMDPVPIILSVTSTLYIWAILSRGMLTAAPIARENLFESMRDGVLVTDRSDLLVDYNRAAAEMIQGLDTSSIGKPLSRLFLPAGKEAAAYVMNADPLLQEKRELEWKQGSETLYYQLRSSPVLKRDGQRAGRMVMLIDVTERTLLQEKLRQLATIDSLTGIYNRPHFMEQTREKLAQAMADRSPLSMILLDIDHFKNINDHYGHAWGDAALQHIVEICGRHLRAGDLFGRYGGEEFVICLAGMDLSGAGQLANRIREDMERERLQTPSGHIAVTSSFGVVEADGAELSLEELLSQADHALYASKRNGRNTVHLHSRSGIIGFIPV
jgi:diguanylate cyclase (GGDEF)-like protein/PAS domain S-box-containing protein